MRLILAVLALVVWPAFSRAQAEQASELQVKAAFLYKFGGYVEWPNGVFAAPEAPFAIGLVGADDMADELAQMVAGRSVNGHPITVRKLKAGAPLAGLHVLFVGRGDPARLGDVLSSAKGRPILVVTESEETLPRGSMINFVVVGDKVRFDIAPASAESGNLRISARLLAVARKVVGQI